MSRLDENELGLRVQAAFSLGELRKLLVSWGATESEQQGDLATLARRLVRQGQTQLGAREMVRRLARENPLVLWPEVQDDPADTRFSPPSEGPDHAVEPAMDVPLEDTATIVDLPVLEHALAAPSGPGERASPSSVAPAPSSDTKAPLIASAPESVIARHNPMLFPPANALREPRKTPRWVFAAAGGVALLVLIGVGFALGRGTNAVSSGPTAATGSAAVVPAASAGLPQNARSVIDQRLEEVAKLCELDLKGAPVGKILEIAAQSCRGVNKPRPLRPELSYQPAPQEAVREPEDPVPSPPTAETRPPTPTPYRPTTPAKSCNARCATSSNQCQSACGPEPRDATHYDNYRSCTARCITQNSHCRLACP